MASEQCAPAPGRVVFPFMSSIALATLAGVLAWSPAAAQTPLSLAQAQRIALAQSRQLPAQDLAASAARDLAVAAGQLPDPILKIGIDNLPVNGPGQFRVNEDSMTMRRIGVMQELTRGEKRRLRAERFERDADLALAEKTVAAAAIKRDTALAWLERYYAEAMAAVIAEQIAHTRLEVAAAEAAYRGGTGRQADVFAARGELAALGDRASEIDRRIRTAKAMLERWIGSDADMPLASLPAMDAVGLDSAGLEARMGGQPGIAVIDKQEAIAATEAKLAQSNKKADWSVEVMYQQRGSGYSNMVSVGLSVPLQWDQRSRQDREVAAKHALLEKTRAQREDALRAQVAQTHAMILEWQNGRERQARYATELLPLAGQRSAATLAAYRAGKAALVDVLGARHDEIDLRLKWLELDAGVARLWAQLRFLFPSSEAARQLENSRHEVGR